LRGFYFATWREKNLEKGSRKDSKAIQRNRNTKKDSLRLCVAFYFAPLREKNLEKVHAKTQRNTRKENTKNALRAFA
jgi:hypothetical protein